MGRERLKSQEKPTSQLLLQERDTRRYPNLRSPSHLLEDFGLEVRRQLGVDGQHGQGRRVLQLFQVLHNLVRGHLRHRRNHGTLETHILKHGFHPSTPVVA